MIALAPVSDGAVHDTVSCVGLVADTVGAVMRAGGSGTFVTLTVTVIVSSIVAVASWLPSASSPSVTRAVIVYEALASRSSVVPVFTLISPVVPPIVNEALSPPLASDQVSVSPSPSVASTVPTVAASALFSAIANVTASPSSNSGDVCPLKLVTGLPENPTTSLPAPSRSALLDSRP